ncbi:MAG TPA: hypothetical protein VMR19_00745 [Candidatus Saccharimonadales bacterium]|nr:hypothetical protein [Candidatus Saccharimonadales bacterium]
MSVDRKYYYIGGSILATILIIVVVIIIVGHNKKNLVSQPLQSGQIQMSLATPTEFVPTVTSPAITSDIPLTGWVFKGFNGEKNVKGRYKYEWANFVNDNGMKLKAMCSAPKSPAPEVEDYYTWIKPQNILKPVKDNMAGNIQRFWYPTIQP